MRWPNSRLTSMPSVGIRVTIWKSLQRLKKSPAIIVTLNGFSDGDCCAGVSVQFGSGIDESERVIGGKRMAVQPSMGLPEDSGALFLLATELMVCD